MSRFLFVVNPMAGRGKGRRAGDAVSKRLLRDNLLHDLVYTREPGEAGRLAAETDADVVVAVGGDGTINEVVNGIRGSQKKLGVIPAGSGNDVIKSLNIPRSVDDALDALQSPVLRMVDTALINCLAEAPGGAEKRSRLFLNGAGIGFDASVARKVASIRRLRGTLSYLAAVFLALREYTCPIVDITADGSQRVQGSKLLVAIGNGVCAGGGFYLTPKARMDDGLLDMCAIPALTVRGILGIIPRVLRGTHISMQGIDYLQGRNFSIHSSVEFAVHADGEIMAETSREVSVGILPASLGVLVPQVSGSG